MNRILTAFIGLSLVVSAIGAKPDPSVKSLGKGKHVQTDHGDQVIVTPVTLDDGRTVEIEGGTVDGVTMEASDQPSVKAGQRVKVQRHGKRSRIIPSDQSGVLDSLLGARVHAYSYTGHRWKDGTIRYFVNTTNPPPPSTMTAAQVNQALTDAALRWVAQTNAQIAIGSVGITTNSVLANNRHNDIFWREKSADDVPGRAMSTYSWWGADGYRLDSDIVLYKGYGAFYPMTVCVSAPYHIFFDATVGHEFGHFLGIQHSTVAAATMYPTYRTACDTSWRSLDGDDIAAARVAYGVKP